MSKQLDQMSPDELATHVQSVSMELFQLTIRVAHLESELRQAALWLVAKTAVVESSESNAEHAS